MHVRALILVVFSVGVACSGSSSTDDGDGGTAEPDAALPPDAMTPPSYCEQLPAKPTTATLLSHVPASEDFTFDREGNLVGVSLQTRALVRTPYTGSPQTLVPGVSDFGRGVRYLTGGDLLIVDPSSSQLFRVTPAGSMTTVQSGMPDPNGLVIGLDGFAYVTHGQGEVRRIDPDTGEYTLLLDTPQSYDGIQFSLDYETLYVNEEVGRVTAIPMNGGTPTTFADIPLNEILDGMTLDECGNLYVVEMAGTIWRVLTDGTVEEYFTLQDEFVFIPAVNFGSGIGGWRRDALYIMNFDGGVYEVPTGGVRGRLEPHLAGL